MKWPRPLRSLSMLFPAAVLSVGAVAVVPGTAGAADLEHNHTAIWNQVPARQWVCTARTVYTQGCFAAHSEYFRLSDGRADGYSVVIEWKLYNGGGLSRRGQIWNLLGSGPAWTYENKSFAENNSLHFRACRGNHKANDVHTSTCTAWRQTTT